MKKKGLMVSTAFAAIAGLSAADGAQAEWYFGSGSGGNSPVRAAGRNFPGVGVADSIFSRPTPLPVYNESDAVLKAQGEAMGLVEEADALYRDAGGTIKRPLHISYVGPRDLAGADVLVIVTGGGWRANFPLQDEYSPYNVDFMRRAAVERGFAVVLAEYPGFSDDPAIDDPYPRSLQGAQCLSRVLGAYQPQMHSLTYLGYSAGGNLVEMMTHAMDNPTFQDSDCKLGGLPWGENRAKPTLVVDWSGVAKVGCEVPYNEEAQGFIGRYMRENNNCPARADASPDSYVAVSTASRTTLTWLITNEGDTLIPPVYVADPFAWNLEANGFPVARTSLPGGHFGGYDNPDTRQMLLEGIRNAVNNATAVPPAP